MNPIVLDTETTGLSWKDNRVIEVAASEFDAETGALLGEALLLQINPEQPVGNSVQIHGKTDEMLKDKPLFKTVVPQIAEFIKGRRLIIHNASFDVGMLAAEFKRAKADEFEKLPESVVCTRKLSRQLMPRQKASLDPLCDRFGIDRSARTVHGALVDISLLALIYPHLAKMAAQQKAKLQTLVPFDLDASLPEDVGLLCNGHFAIEAVIRQLKAEQGRIEELISKMQEGKNYADRDSVVEFAPPGKRTEWDKFVADHAPGIDLTPYQKPVKGQMKIKPAA